MSFSLRIIQGPLFFIFILALTTPGLTACDSVFDLKPEEHISRAKDSFDSGDLRAAVIELKSALQKAPNNVEARWLLGRAYLEEGAAEEAEKEILRAIDLGLVKEDAAIPLARALLLQGKYKQIIDSSVSLERLPKHRQAELLAVRGHAHLGLLDSQMAANHYDKALSIAPDSPDAGIGKALILAARNQTDDARLWIDKVLEKNPGFAKAWILLGDIEFTEKKYQEALNAYSQAVTDEKVNSEALLKRVRTLIELEQFDAAHKDINVVKTTVKHNPIVPFTEGLLLLREKNIEQAQTEFQKTLSLQQDYWPAVYFLGITNYLNGNLETANSLLTRYLNAHTNSAVAAKALGYVRILMEDYSGAESILKPVVLSNPQDKFALSLLSNAALHQGKTDEVVGYREQVISLDPESPQSHLDLAIALLAQNKMDEAVAQLKNAVQLDAEFQPAEQQLLVTYLNNGEFDAAIEIAKRMLEKDPGQADILILLGGAYVGKGDYKEAKKNFYLAREASPENFYATFNLAMLELRQGNVQSARELYLEYLQHSPNELNALMSLGSLDLSQGRLEEAKSWVEKAVRAHPAELAPRITLASYYLKKGDPNKALELTAGLTNRNPNNAGLFAVVGKAQLMAGSPETALQTFRELVQIRPESAETRFLLYQVYLELGDTKSARETLEKLLMLTPGDFASTLAMVQFLIKQREAAAASKLLNTLQQSHPEHPDVLLLTGELALLESRFTDAVNAFAKARERAPNNRELVQRHASAYWQLKDYNASFEIQKDWLKSHPEDRDAQFALANSYLTLVRMPQAVSAFYRTVEIWPDNPLALNNLAWLIRKEKPEEALVYARKAVSVDPNAYIFRDTLGKILLEQGDSKQAVVELKKAALIAKANPDVQYNLAQALVSNGEKVEARTVLAEILKTQQPFANLQSAKALLDSLK